VRKEAAAAGSVAFFALAPGVVAGAVPWWLTDWQTREPLPYLAPARVLGAALLAVGLLALAHAFTRFVVEGHGTPAPVAPTSRLVVGGLYRYVRNPMYLAVTAIIVGQGLALGQLVLLAYAAIVCLTVAAFVYAYEEPTLSRQFGAQYEAYRDAVPAWWPRRRPWTPPELDQAPSSATSRGGPTRANAPPRPPASRSGPIERERR
jgi:protein-S-isoprenylcysteine O-methyltransferase Ste14